MSSSKIPRVCFFWRLLSFRNLAWESYIPQISKVFMARGTLGPQGRPLKEDVFFMHSATFNNSHCSLALSGTQASSWAQSYSFSPRVLPLCWIRDIGTTTGKLKLQEKHLQEDVRPEASLPFWVEGRRETRVFLPVAGSSVRRIQKHLLQCGENKQVKQAWLQ